MEQFIFLDDLEIVSPLGRGAYSLVYKVRNRSTNDFYALKIVSKQKVNSRASKRLENEICLQSSLSHPNIVKLLKSFEDSENFYLLLELCTGGELFSYIKTKGKLDETETKKIAMQIVEGLCYLHSKNILHRDLKLGNILMTEDQDVKIADFGLAAQLTDLNEERTTLCGTPNYISPEIVERKPYGLASDLWSLGCILFACLVGHPPFDSPNIQDTLLKLRDMKFCVPEGLSEEAKELIGELMDWEPKRRLSIFEVREHRFFKPKRIPCLQISGISPIRHKEKFYEYSESMESSRFVPSQNYIRSQSRARNYSANKENIFPEENDKIEAILPVSTENLPPFVHLLGNGKMEITRDGWLNVEIGKKVLEVSPDGAEICFMGKRMDGKGLKRTPARMYKLGIEFVQVLRSKTPKVMVEEGGARCMLMSNSPFPNFEVDFKDGTRVKYQIGSEVFTIFTLEGKEVRINPYLDKNNLGNKFDKILETAMNGLKKCLAKEKRQI